MSVAPANASMLGVVLVDALGMSMHNAVVRQQNASISAGAAVTAACARLLQAHRDNAPEVAAPADPAAVVAAAFAEGSAAIGALQNLALGGGAAAETARAALSQLASAATAAINPPEVP